MRFRTITLFGFAVVSVAAVAHDIWIESDPFNARLGEPIKISLLLGNHGNLHRDFKIASKVAAGDQHLGIIEPSGKARDLTPSLMSTPPEASEGYWSTSYTPQEGGLYLAYSTLDKVMSYAPIRDIKSAKAYFFAGKDTSDAAKSFSSLVLHHPLEIVPLSYPGTFRHESEAFQVKVLYKDKPLRETVVSFIPKGTTLSGEFDPRFERKTNAKGEASVNLASGKVYLIATRKTDEDAKGPGYNSIGYSATLVVGPARK